MDSGIFDGYAENFRGTFKSYYIKSPKHGATSVEKFQKNIEFSRFAVMLYL